MHLISINPAIWRIVQSGYVIADELNPTPDEDKLIHANAQAVNALFQCLSGEEFNRVSSFEKAKDIWITLQEIHEGTSTVRESRLELLKGKLDRFVMGDEESPSDISK